MPSQVGVGVKGGCETLIHAARHFVAGMDPEKAFVKLDFVNSMRRDSVLKAAARPDQAGLCDPGVLARPRICGTISPRFFLLRRSSNETILVHWVLVSSRLTKLSFFGSQALLFRDYSS